jgi:retron-type reverse transcriptase
VRFTSLAHHITKERLYAAYKTLKRRASPGVDGVSVESYGLELEKNIENLHQRLCEGKYRALPVRRIYILKENGKRRPIGIPALEDKIVQAAVVSLLEPIYQKDFFDLSYGFRPGRNQHQALDAVLNPIKGGRVQWLLDVDLSGFFD